MAHDTTDLDAIGVNTASTTPLRAVLARRAALQGLLGLAAAGLGARAGLAAGTSSLAFREIAHGPTPDHAVAEGYTARVLIRWGDNIAFDGKGRMWIASDQGEQQQKYGIGDGIWACDTEGPGRAVTRMFYRTPTGAEMCGPAFTPDNRSFFVAVQHPAGDDEGSSFDTPSSRWPDFDPKMPPRPAVVVITKDDGGVIGS